MPDTNPRLQDEMNQTITVLRIMKNHTSRLEELSALTRAISVFEWLLAEFFHQSESRNIASHIEDRLNGD